MIINLLTERGPYRLADAPSDGKWWDVNGDGLVTALDALIVINRLNKWGNHPALPGSVSDPEHLDVNRDGKIDWADAHFVLDYLHGKREFCSTCDVNEDGLVTAFDALLIINFLSQYATNDGSADADFHDAALAELLKLKTENAEEDSPFEPLLDDAVDLLALDG